MPRTRRDLINFAEWLYECRFSATTVNSYVSEVRQCLRAMANDLSMQTALNDHIASISPARRTGTRCAWRAFRDYCAQRGVEGIASIPDGRTLQQKRPVIEVAIPHEPMVAELYAAVAMFTVRNRVKSSTMAKMRWGAVTNRTINHPDWGMGIIVRDEENRISLVIPEATLQYLRHRADPVNGTPIPEAPILPRVPGSLEVYPLSALRRCFP